MNWQQTIASFRIGKRYHDVNLEFIGKTYPELVVTARKWLSTPEKHPLFLSGKTGCGKTCFAIALLRELVAQGHPWIIYVRSDDLDSELLRSLEDRQESTVIRKYSEVPILFIDDIGVETMSDRVKRQYYAILDSRLNDCMTTIVTSNLSASNLDVLGDRIKSRLESYAEIKFPNRDLRKEKL